MNLALGEQRFGLRGLPRDAYVTEYHPGQWGVWVQYATPHIMLSIACVTEEEAIVAARKSWVQLKKIRPEYAAYYQGRDDVTEQVEVVRA
jgi:hypothetical protein